MAGVSTSLRALVPSLNPRLEFRTYHDRESAERGRWLGDGESRRFVRLFSDYRGPFYVPPIEEGMCSDNALVRAECGRMRLLLPSIHGVVFVADSQHLRAEANAERLARVVSDFQSVGRDAASIPFVFQLNKRDLPEVMPVDEMRRLLAMPQCAYVDSVATKKSSQNAA